MHVDMDAFYAAVEQLHKPSLRGKPVVVGGVGRRGVVATASYEARAFGVHSAMPSSLARRRCPNGAFLAPRFGAYQVISARVMELLREVSPVVEPLSLDEAFVELDASPDGPPADERAAREVGRRLRRRIVEVTGLDASVGVGTSKLIAKVASDAEKPNGLVVVPPGGEQDWLDPLPIRALWGVGPATARRLREVGVGTVAELRSLSIGELIGLLGKAHGGSLFQLARGVDERGVAPHREAKSISAEDTFAFDLVDADEIRAELRRLVERVVSRLRHAGRTARTVTLKIRDPEFTTLTRSETLAAPTDDERVVLRSALCLLADVGPVPGGVRLLGAGVSGFADYAQQDLLALADRVEREADEGEAEKTDEASLSPSPDGPSDALRRPVERAGARDSAAVGRRSWFPGQDVVHAEHGPGWVQGSGLGRVTVRFETPSSAPGRVRTLSYDDPALSPADAALVARAELERRAG
jgi:DNA polymerase-4